MLDPRVADALRRGVVIPACPLALTAERRFDERRQRALFRYYLAAGAGGLAVGVHTTQFAIREPKFGLFRPLLQLAAEEMSRMEDRGSRIEKTALPPSSIIDPRPSTIGQPIIRIAGVCGSTPQALAEAAVLRECGYHAGLLSLVALKGASEDQLIAHCRNVAEVIPLFGFYLNPELGGPVLSYSFWNRFAEIDNVVAIKVAPFDRYRSQDVVRAIVAAGRDDIALYTGNDDTIVMDLLTPFRFETGRGKIERRIVGGLLGQWAVWTKKAVDLLEECHRLIARGGDIPVEMLRRSVEVTDVNSAVFDAANGFAGCIPGVHEILRRQGLLEGIWCLNPEETLSPGQAEEIDRIYRAYPHLNDDSFVRENLDQWMR